ncbi:uncharacterized protein LOC123865625 [Maniola jurtina]|uniref:uncharacterized protein LOC123865625 n=1 Tax=Maniola jurtina TaxID=191418 RepID=UPI001E686465|nr:uncharacterized protein LOC123865625 [Maniola jurtina]
MKGIISSQNNTVKTIFDQNIDLDIENIDTNNLQVIEIVGNDLQQEPPEFATVAIEYPQPSLLNAQDPKSSASTTPSCSSKLVILSNVPYHGDLLSHKKRQNKAAKNPKKYQRNVNKELRMKGEHYFGYRKAKTNEKFKVKQDVFEPARSMKPPCTSPFCKKSKLGSCDNINEQQRQYFFENFWKNMNWQQ